MGDIQAQNWCVNTIGQFKWILNDTSGHSISDVFLSLSFMSLTSFAFSYAGLLIFISFEFDVASRIS